MMAYSMFDTDQCCSAENANPPDQKYAWLEHEGGVWHFLTNLFDDPGKSMRKWTDEQRALQELENEGWIVVYPYKEQIPMNQKYGERACGYGLMWIDQRMVS